MMYGKKNNEGKKYAFYSDILSKININIRYLNLLRQLGDLC